MKHTFTATEQILQKASKSILAEKIRSQHSKYHKFRSKETIVSDFDHGVLGRASVESVEFADSQTDMIAL